MSESKRPVGVKKAKKTPSAKKPDQTVEPLPRSSVSIPVNHETALSLSTGTGAGSITTRPNALVKLVPRALTTACLAFWFALCALMFPTLRQMQPTQMALLGILAVCSSAIVVHLGMLTTTILRRELSKLAMLARRDQANETAEFDYDEFSIIAKEIRSSNAIVRDELENLRLAAYRDMSNGLPNRLSLIPELAKGMSLCDERSPCAVFHIILDGFTSAEHVLGVTGGERLQSMVASRLTMFLAEGAANEDRILQDVFLASLGIGQFAMYMPHNAGRKKAALLARQLQLVFNESFDLDGRSISVKLSGGIAVAPDDGKTPEKLLKNASLALNEVLRAGKVGFQFFSPRLERLAKGRAQFERELRDAVAKEAFRPVFQSKIDLSTGEIAGVEALARWYRTEDQIISPGTFIPLAEELGLIDDIGFQILRQSCDAAADWLRAGHDIPVAVNVAPCQFDRPDFINQVVAALNESSLPPRMLELEITETMAVSNPEQVATVMKPLRAMGVKLAIDDFGTGHANLSLLTQLPFDIFKIDRQFVSALDNEEQAPAVIEMILSMARTLGMKTVAEGIETEEQAAFLTRRGCTLGQGYLYSRPIPVAEFRKLVREWPKSDTVANLRKAG
jgi:predicted signal transduction protein with EAL and GGDEF domain